MRFHLNRDGGGDADDDEPADAAPSSDSKHSTSSESLSESSDSSEPPASAHPLSFELPASPISAATVAAVSGDQDSLKMATMNNYFGIGIDAELSLAFHLAREENPEKCTSR